MLYTNDKHKHNNGWNKGTNTWIQRQLPRNNETQIYYTFTLSSDNGKIFYKAW